MHNQESVLENETHKLLWDFEIQTDHLISARRPDLVIINKKKRTCQTEDFAFSADHRVKLKENEKRDKYQDLARELKDTNYNLYSWYSHQRIDTETRRFGNKRMSEDHPNYSIIKIGQNTVENPGDLRRFAVSKTPVRNHRLSLLWKTRKGLNNDNLISAKRSNLVIVNEKKRESVD